MGSLRFLIATCLVALAVLEGRCVSGAAAVPRADEKIPFSLKEVLDGSFSASGLGAVWISGNELASFAESSIRKYNVEEDVTETIVTSSKLAETGYKTTGTWVFSEDTTKLLWGFDAKAGFRHSTTAKYSVLDVSEGTWNELHNGDHLQTALLAPGNNGVAYVVENDVYYVKDISSNEPRRITDDNSNDIYNGVPDWVYEEEVLSSGSAMWFSPTGKYLAFGKFDDTDVKDFRYITYGNDKYTKLEELRYPKPGTDNPIATINIVDLLDPESKPIAMNSDDTEFKDYILQNVAWASDDKLLVVWLNRIQNKILIYSYTASEAEGSGETTWTRNEEFQDTQENGWYQVSTPRVVSDTQWAQLLPLKLEEGDDQGYLRPFLFKDGTTAPSVLVNEKITATALYGWDTDKKNLFYQAAPAGLPGQRQVYSVSAEGDEPKCLSCGTKQVYNDEDCVYASASFSRDFSHAAITCSGPGPATVGLIKVSNGAGEWVDYLQKNEDLISKLGKRLLPSVVSDTISVEEGYTAQIRLWLPPNFDKSKKYPMLVYVYGGPGSQQVSEAFSIGWGTYLTTAKNIIYASIDGRGSGYQGNKNLFAIYRKLGTHEVQDQIDVTKKLIEKNSFIDKDRVGIWGWSYGGYATGKAIALDSDEVFACGASVAPVTSWDLYDTIYTERYMDLPDDNAEGYAEASISKDISNFKKHQFYLLHGNADDNVHYQQSMRLARALEENDVFFEQQSYPDENHSIRSVITHVYMSLGVFFDRCFEPEATTGAAGHVLPALLPALLFPLLSLLFV